MQLRTYIGVPGTGECHQTSVSDPVAERTKERS
jgi:hypothetical protein